VRLVRVPFGLCVIFMGVCLRAPESHAAVIAMDVPSLGRTARQVVVAHVRDLVPAWGPQHTEIVTNVVLDVEETVAGPPAPRLLTIQVPGGRLGDLGCYVSEMPTFEVGERCVLFLAPGHCPVLGGFQGKKAVVQDRILGEALTLGDLRAVVRQARSGGAGALPLREPETPAAPPLQQGRDITPVITGITPPETYAGAGLTVTITGSNFGDTQGTSTVHFYKGGGGSPIEAESYGSWSDTEIQCVVPKGASSGSVTVTTAAGTSNGYSIVITFGFGKMKWYSTPPSFRVNPNASDCTGEETAIAAAASTWSSHPGNSPFSFSYAGTTSLGYARDYSNTCVWVTGLGSTTLAVNTVWYYTSSTPWSISEFDIRFNDDFTWSTGASTPSSQYDVQSTATHELGHALMLTDLYGSADSAKVMYGYGSPGAQKRSIHIADQTGLYWTYPNSSGPTAVRLADVRTAFSPLGTLLRFSYLDPRPLVGFRIRGREQGGGIARLGDVPYEFGAVRYEYLDRGPRLRPDQYRIDALMPDGRLQPLLWPALFGPP
jgi:hypothetical protein